jgi:hypothetical protein
MMANSNRTSVTTSNERWEITNVASSLKEEAIATGRTKNSVYSHHSPYTSNPKTKKTVSFLPTLTVPREFHPVLNTPGKIRVRFGIQKKNIVRSKCLLWNKSTS